MTGEKREVFLTVDDILFYTNGGKDIYLKYLGKINKSMRCPWRKDTIPSWGVFLSNGLYYYKDHDDGSSGSAIQFVQKLFGLSFADACNKIKWDFSLGGKPSISQKVYENKVKEENKRIHIATEICVFDKKHAKYWNDYHLTEEYLRKYNVFRVKNLWINRQKVYLHPDELTFVYRHEPSKSEKILRIGVDPILKWRNNAAGSTLWLKEFLQDTDKLVVSKSLKDSLCLSLFGVNTVALQSESLSCVESNETWFKELIKPVYVMMGTDAQGKSQSHLITAKYGFKHYNTPDYLLEEGNNDFASWVAKDIKAAEEHLKSKI